VRTSLRSSPSFEKTTMLLLRLLTKHRPNSIAKACAWHCPRPKFSIQNELRHKANTSDWMPISWPRFASGLSNTRHVGGNVCSWPILLKKSVLPDCLPAENAFFARSYAKSEPGMLCSK
jgi:hypothetical protein